MSLESPSKYSSGVSTLGDNPVLPQSPYGSFSMRGDNLTLHPLSWQPSDTLLFIEKLSNDKRNAENENNTLRSQVSQMQNEIFSRRTSIHDCNLMIKDLQQDIEDFKKLVKVKDDAINHHLTSLTELRAKLAECKNQGYIAKNGKVKRKYAKKK